MIHNIEVFNGNYITSVTLHLDTNEYDHIIIYYDDEPSIIIWRKNNGFTITPISVVFDNIKYFTI